MEYKELKTEKWKFIFLVTITTAMLLSMVLLQQF